ncbi:hypothetical protein Ancab_007801 [Ancistrocladus abbreviatus]
MVARTAKEMEERLDLDGVFLPLLRRWVLLLMDFWGFLIILDTIALLSFHFEDGWAGSRDGGGGGGGGEVGQEGVEVGNYCGGEEGGHKRLGVEERWDHFVQIKSHISINMVQRCSCS